VGLRGPHAVARGSRPRPQRFWKPHVEPIATPGRPPTSTAARVRRHRERQKSGKLVVMLELDADDLEVLVEARLLDTRSDCFNREAIATAVRKYLQKNRDRR
jgi:hypothetical protein